MDVDEIIEVIKDLPWKIGEVGDCEVGDCVIRCFLKHSNVDEEQCFCPITAFCFLRTGRVYGPHFPYTAGKVSDIPEELTTQIVLAADGNKKQDLDIRQKLLTLVKP